MAITKELFTNSVTGFTSYRARNDSVVGPDGKYNAPIHILTYDGTASDDPRRISDPHYNPGGGYPQELASLLVDADPTTWAWRPFGPPEYDPMLALADCPNGFINPIGGNLWNGLNAGINYVKANPGKKFVLAGLSQGTLVTGPLYNEFRFGTLQSQRADLIGVINFGDACRGAKQVIPMHGATDPGGTGAALFRMQQTYQQPSLSGSGLHTNPDTFYWPFVQPNDAAAAVSSTASNLVKQIAWRLFYNQQFGGPSRPLPMGPGPGLLPKEPFLEWAFTVVGRRNNTSITSIIGAILQWWPFAWGAMAPNLWNDIVIKGLKLNFPYQQIWNSRIGNFMSNPHAQYSRPFPYRALKNNSKTPVELAFGHLLSLGRQYTPTSIPVSSPPSNKPYWFLTFGKPGDIFDPSQNSIRSSWPFLTTTGATNRTLDFGKRDLDTAQPGPAASAAAAVNAAKVGWVPVSYSASVFPSRLAVEAAVERAVRLISAAPSGTKFFLGGDGLGAVVSTRVYDEFQRGRLQSRKANLLGVYHFGNPLRPSGKFRNEANPGGQGMAVRLGASVRPLSSPHNAAVWEFVATNDPVARQNSNDQRGVWSAEAFAVMYRNVQNPQEFQSILNAQARQGNTPISNIFASELAVALYSTATSPHNTYGTFIPRPKASPGKSAVQLTIDDINAKAV